MNTTFMAGDVLVKSVEILRRNAPAIFPKYNKVSILNSEINILHVIAQLGNGRVSHEIPSDWIHFLSELESTV